MMHGQFPNKDAINTSFRACLHVVINAYSSSLLNPFGLIILYLFPLHVRGDGRPVQVFSVESGQNSFVESIHFSNSEQ